MLKPEDKVLLEEAIVGLTIKRKQEMDVEAPAGTHAWDVLQGREAQLREDVNRLKVLIRRLERSR